LIDIDQAMSNRRIGSVFANAFGEITFTPWLRYRLNFGTQYRQFRNGTWTGPNATSHLTNKPNTAGYSTNQSFAWVAENLLYFQKKSPTSMIWGSPCSSRPRNSEMRESP